jgi:hypothetical protein
MNKTNLLLGAFIFSAMFLFGCSSKGTCSCGDEPSSSSVGIPSSSSGGGITEDQKLIRKNITLSLDSSYADVDDPTVYTKEGVASNLSKIDLVAHCDPNMDMGCKNNSIYSPREIGLFWNPTYIGSQVYLFNIPSEQANIFKTASKLSEIIPTLNLLIETFNGTSGVREISIAAGKAIFVYTPENIRVAIVKEAGDKSVDLEILLIPNN